MQLYVDLYIEIKSAVDGAIGPSKSWRLGP